MGQHKYNPTAIAAKEGKLPPKKKNKMSKRESERLAQEQINAYLKKKTGICPSDFY